MLFANKILRSKKTLRSFTSRHPGELATKVRYFGVKSTKVHTCADRHQPAKVGRLAHVYNPGAIEEEAELERVHTPRFRILLDPLHATLVQ